ncbi:MAG: peptidoglycan-associated lipoprotein Pal [Candidatus Sumerlaeia bacterium]|nr:peptidoglycan-associated lipoprotein Pal [Candidatus Sumerlaeia bacterium]
MKGTCTRIVLTSCVAVSLVLAGCAKKPRPDAEVRVPGATKSSLAGGNARLGPGGAWSPADGPPMLDPSGSGASRLAGSPFGPDSGTGGFAQNANLAGVENAVQIADLDMVHFEYDQFGLSPEWQRVLDGHAQWLASNASVHVQIEGHCDERGTEEYNVSLGQRRADAVREYLAGKGIEPFRMSTISYGKLRPLTFDQNEQSHSLNRRAMFLVYSPGTQTAAAY